MATIHSGIPIIRSGELRTYNQSYMETSEIHRFDIFWVPADTTGAQTLPEGTRPYPIVTPYCDNQKKGIVLVAPITSNTKTASESAVPIQINGRDSVILLDRLATIETTPWPIHRETRYRKGARGSKDTQPAVYPRTSSSPGRSSTGSFKRKDALRGGPRFEFKEITSARRLNVIKNVADEYSVAFLNSEGGRIFWGVRDSDRVVVGVKLTLSERDEVRKEVVSKLAGIQPDIDIVQLRLDFHEVFENGAVVADLFIVELSVPRGKPTTMHFTSGGDAFVRLDGVKLKLKGPQIQQWIMGRMKAAVLPSLTPAERKRQEILEWKWKDRNPQHHEYRSCSDADRTCQGHCRCDGNRLHRPLRHHIHKRDPEIGLTGQY